MNLDYFFSVFMQEATDCNKSVRLLVIRNHQLLRKLRRQLPVACQYLHGLQNLRSFLTLCFNKNRNQLPLGLCFLICEDRCCKCQRDSTQHIVCNKSPIGRRRIGKQATIVVFVQQEIIHHATPFYCLTFRRIPPCTFIVAGFKQIFHPLLCDVNENSL